jgi:hypothetical protein
LHFVVQDANLGAIGRDFTALKVDSGTSVPDQSIAGLISGNTCNLIGLNQVRIMESFNQMSVHR